MQHLLSARKNSSYFKLNRKANLSIIILYQARRINTYKEILIMRLFTINEVAMMTGFTTRTLRNYISVGILEGEKIEGVWKFSVDNFTNFISNPNVISGIKSKMNAQALDFLADNKNRNQTATAI